MSSMNNAKPVIFNEMWSRRSTMQSLTAEKSGACTPAVVVVQLSDVESMPEKKFSKKFKRPRKKPVDYMQEIHTTRVLNKR